MTKIIDSAGRIGRITEDRGDCVFAIPDDLPQSIDGIYPGVGKATFMTATAWYKQSDGGYTGLWFDSPMHTRLRAVTVAAKSEE
jgi:hypothetical protein